MSSFGLIEKNGIVSYFLSWTLEMSVNNKYTKLNALKKQKFSKKTDLGENV